MGIYEEMLEAFRAGDNERTRRLSTAALDASDASGDLSGQVDAICMLARVALRDGDFKWVRDLADQARTRACIAADRRLERMPLHMQAVSARMSGNFHEARRFYEESIELNRSLGEERMVAAEYHNLAYVELHDGRPDRAKELFRRARGEARRIGYEALNPYLVGDLAVIAAIDADAATAARLAGAAASGFAAARQVPDPDDAAEQQRLSDELSRELGAETFRSLYEEGASLTPAEILASLQLLPNR
jgi:tetratricopeptide (TPR) repeat protein